MTAQTSFRAGHRVDRGPSAPLPTGGTVLALDLGTTTGFALHTPDGAIASGTVVFRPGRFEGAGMSWPERELVRQLGDKLYGTRWEAKHG